MFKKFNIARKLALFENYDIKRERSINVTFIDIAKV